MNKNELNNYILSINDIFQELKDEGWSIIIYYIPHRWSMSSKYTNYCCDSIHLIIRKKNCIRANEFPPNSTFSINEISDCVYRLIDYLNLIDKSIMIDMSIIHKLGEEKYGHEIKYITGFRHVYNTISIEEIIDYKLGVNVNEEILDISFNISFPNDKNVDQYEYGDIFIFEHLTTFLNFTRSFIY